MPLEIKNYNEMKTKQFILTVMVIVLAASVFATDKPKMNIIPLEDTKALVAASQATPSVNQISIVSEEGQMVYFKESKKEMEGYKQIFNLSLLSDGNYEVKLKTGTVTVKRGISIDQGIISVKPMETEYEPVFIFANNVLKVSYLNFEKEEVKIKVFNNEGLIYKSELGDNFALTQGYDFSKLEKGNYSVLLADNSHGYWFTVTK